MIKVSAIIVHWNTPEILKSQLELLTEGRSDLDIVVVDNKSEESLNFVRKVFPSVKLIENKKNYGFAKACNIGARHARGEWLLFLNPDVEITGNQIGEMVNFAEKSNFGACSPTSSTPGYDKPLPTPWTLFIEFTPLGKLLLFIRSLAPSLRLGMTRGEKTLFGGCLLIKADVFKEVGGWGEDFFLWFEDSDLTVRLLSKGYKIGWAPIKVEHKGAVSFLKLKDEDRKRIFFESMNLYAKKHFGPLGRFIINLLKKRYVNFS